MQVPPNLLLNYVNLPSLSPGFFTTVWGLASALTSLFTNYGQIVACLFLLALAGAFPIERSSVVVSLEDKHIFQIRTKTRGPFLAGIISKWYTKEELALHMSIFYSGSLISGAFGNLIAAGILKCLNGTRGLAPWQWLYIIETSQTPGNYSHRSSDVSPTDRRLSIESAEVDVDTGSRDMSQFTGLITRLFRSKNPHAHPSVHGLNRRERVPEPLPHSNPPAGVQRRHLPSPRSHPLTSSEKLTYSIIHIYQTVLVTASGSSSIPFL
ncbi:hypothetical protein PABG_04659 [Paracoccidioides brasiliensis Pb03]|nr:hypothetical protein PABG_04659 [Paracoccidioides brasiliensis Pb03]